MLYEKFMRDLIKLNWFLNHGKWQTKRSNDSLDIKPRRREAEHEILFLEVNPKQKYHHLPGHYLQLNPPCLKSFHTIHRIRLQFKQKPSLLNLVRADRYRKIFAVLWVWTDADVPISAGLNEFLGDPTLCVGSNFCLLLVVFDCVGVEKIVNKGFYLSDLLNAADWVWVCWDRSFLWVLTQKR